MARSSQRLDLKRDDPRTLMIKMDARLTFAGRERNHAFRMEAERELRHLDYARHLTRATLERQQKEMQKRMDFLKNLVEENRARRKLKEEQMGVDQDSLANVSGESAVERRKRKENALTHSLPVIPARRNLEDLVNSIQRKQPAKSSMSRSLGYLSESYSEYRTQETLSERRLRQLKQEMRDAKKKDMPKVQITGDLERPTESPKVVWAKTEEQHSKNSRGGVATQTISLPEITGSRPTNQTDIGAAGRRVSLSQMIASGEITKLPGIGAGSHSMTSPGGQQNLNIARTFYMNTSQAAGRGPMLQPIAQSSQLKPTAQDVGGSNSSKRGWVKLPAPSMVPLKFLQEGVEQNPFMTADFKPDTSRPRELLQSNKPEEMYVWLGFDSEEEFRQMVKQAKEETDAESDDNTSNGGDDLVELEVIEEVEENLDNDAERAGAEYLRKRRTSRRVSRLSAPVAMIASSLNNGMTDLDRKRPSGALKKFIRAAKTICIVRQFQLNGNKGENPP